MIKFFTDFLTSAELWMNSHLKFVNHPLFIPVVLTVFVAALAISEMVKNRKGKIW